MTEYNNTSSYPDSVRAARITVGDIPKNYCDYLYQRDVKEGSQAGLGFGIVKYVLTCSITIRSSEWKHKKSLVSVSLITSSPEHG